jgi:hypothetical protein
MFNTGDIIILDINLENTYLSKLLLSGESVVKTKDANVLLTSTLLGLDQTGGTIDTNDQTSSNLGIESTAVTSLFNTKDTTNPSDDFVGRRVGRLSKVE